MSASSTTATSATNGTTSTYDPTKASEARLPQQTLSQGDFLKLLVAQLSAQDPLNPVSNTDFAAQMAQYSTLQATQAMQKNLTAVQSGIALMEAGSLLGKTVNITDSTGQTVTGSVTAIQYQGGSPSVIVNGQAYDISQVTSVSQTETQTQNK
jgi:flagellar basal-body rod modification protein FlgD